MIDIKVPTVGESINEVSLAKWLKQDGQWVERDEVLAEIESEKATFEINAEQAGIPDASLGLNCLAGMSARRK
jgi:2-oxoglutarate dehydrogenase E2 component (dihydrolipoamide succinyltransferase)